MGEHSEAFTVDGSYRTVYELAARYWRDLGYTIKETREYSYISFKRGRLRRNVFTFSLEDAYKEVLILLVKGEGVPVTTIHLHFSVPLVALRKNDIRRIRSTVRAFKEYIEIALGYQVRPSREALP